MPGFSAGGTMAKRSNQNLPNSGLSYAGLRPGLGRAGVTKNLLLVGKGGGLHKPIVVFQNQVGGIGRGPVRKCGGPICNVTRYQVPTPPPAPSPTMLEEFPPEHTPAPSPSVLQCRFLTEDGCKARDNECEWNEKTGKCQKHHLDIDGDGIITDHERLTGAHFKTIAEKIHHALEKTQTVDSIHRTLLKAHKTHPGHKCAHATLHGELIIGSDDKQNCKCEDECSTHPARIHLALDGSHIDFEGQTLSNCETITSGGHSVHLYIYKHALHDFDHDGKISPEEAEILKNLKILAEKIAAYPNVTKLVDDILNTLLKAYGLFPGPLCAHLGGHGGLEIGAHGLESCPCDDECSTHPARVHKNHLGDDIHFEGQTLKMCSTHKSGEQIVHVHSYEHDLEDFDHDGVVSSEEEKIVKDLKELAQQIYKQFPSGKSWEALYEVLLKAYNAVLGDLCLHLGGHGEIEVGSHGLESCLCDGECNTHEARVHKNHLGDDIHFEGQTSKMCTAFNSDSVKVHVHSYEHALEDFDHDGVVSPEEEKIVKELKELAQQIQKKFPSGKSWEALYEVLLKAYNAVLGDLCLHLGGHGEIEVGSHGLESCLCDDECSTNEARVHKNHLGDDIHFEGQTSKMCTAFNSDSVKVHVHSYEHALEDFDHDGVVSTEEEKIVKELKELAQQIHKQFPSGKSWEALYEVLLKAYNAVLGDLCLHLGGHGEIEVGSHGLESCLCDEKCNTHEARVHKNHLGDDIHFEGQTSKMCTAFNSDSVKVHVHSYEHELEDADHDGVVSTEEEKIADAFYDIAKQIKLLLKGAGTVETIYQEILKGYHKDPGHVCYHVGGHGETKVGSHAKYGCDCASVCNTHPNRIHLDSDGQHINFDGQKLQKCSTLKSGSYQTHLYQYEHALEDADHDGVVSSKEQKIADAFYDIAKQIKLLLKGAGTVETIYQEILKGYHKDPGHVCYHIGGHGETKVGSHAKYGCDCASVCNTHHNRIHLDSDGQHINFDGQKLQKCSTLKSGSYQTHLYQYGTDAANKEQLIKDLIKKLLSKLKAYGWCLPEFMYNMITENIEEQLHSMVSSSGLPQYLHVDLNNFKLSSVKDSCNKCSNTSNSIKTSTAGELVLSPDMMHPKTTNEGFCVVADNVHLHVQKSHHNLESLKDRWGSDCVGLYCPFDIGTILHNHYNSSDFSSTEKYLMMLTLPDTTLACLPSLSMHIENYLFKLDCHSKECHNKSVCLKAVKLDLHTKQTKLTETVCVGEKVLDGRKLCYFTRLQNTFVGIFKSKDSTDSYGSVAVGEPSPGDQKY